MPIKDYIKGFGGMVGRGLEGAAATGIVTGAAAGAHHVYNALTKARDFKEMLSSPFNADLQDVHKNDPTRFNSAFNSLRSVHAPLTQDPMVAGAYMRRIMSYDNAGATGILVEALSQKDRMPANPITEAMARGGQIGVQGVFTNRINQMSDDRQPGVQAAGEKAKLELRTYGPLAGEMDRGARSMEEFKAKVRGDQEIRKIDYVDAQKVKAEAQKLQNAMPKMPNGRPIVRPPSP